MGVESTTCSVTCGLGRKTERRCTVEKSGSRHDCENVMVECVTGWLCGMHTYTLTVGQYFTIDCLSSEFEANVENMLYYWKIANGIVTTDDMLFRTLQARNYTIVFPDIQEKNAGTYRCDVQRVNDLKLVKRLYYGIKVISPNIVYLNYDKFLISKQKLEALAAQQEGLAANVTEDKVQRYSIFKKRVYIMLGAGSCVGILAGIGVGILLLYLFRIKNVDIEDVDK
ncbi:transmembrane protein 81-like [Mixophyes fleayi]|uniref:transmembrane protein 81-like n=1 Tax=Mixophyes fleayi TaxID=3061075 RepID=UPI003F4D9D88